MFGRTLLEKGVFCNGIEAERWGEPLFISAEGSGCGGCCEQRVPGAFREPKACPSECGLRRAWRIMGSKRALAHRSWNTESRDTREVSS